MPVIIAGWMDDYMLLYITVVGMLHRDVLYLGYYIYSYVTWSGCL